MSSTNFAAYIEAMRAHPLVVRPAPMPPSPSPEQLTIKTHSIAVNGIDCIIQQTGLVVPEDAYPFILGNDIAGEVVAVGSSVSKVKPGDRVIACAGSGCFQSFNTVDQALVTILPDHITYTQGSVLPLTLCTAAVMLFQQDTLALDLPQVEPVSNGKVVLVWGGASAVGSNGIQMLRAAGYKVAAVAGSSNQRYCQELGADYVFDHMKPGVATEIIHQLTGVPFAGVFCAIMAPETIQACAQIASQLGDNPKNKFVATSLAHSMKYEGEIPEGVTIGYCWGDSLKHNEVGPAIWDKWLTPALANGTMKCKPEPVVIGKGLEAIQGAMDIQSRGVSAKKLVVEIL